MMIKERVAEALNQQLVSEFTAEAQYLAIAVYFDEEVLPELAGFFYSQADEERMHALKIIHFMLETGAKPHIPPIGEVQNAFAGAEEAVELALNHEKKVTDEIDNLVNIALDERDNTSNNFLQWFVQEQVEEVDTMTNLLHTIRHAQGNLLWVEDYVRRNPQHAEEGGVGAI